MKEASKLKNKSYINRKNCIKKKAKELSILCDIKVCLISFGPDGNCETWPENRNEVVGMIEAYKKYQQHRRGVSRKKVDSIDRGIEKNDKAIVDSLLLREVDLKTVGVNQRIEYLKMMSAVEEQSCGMGMRFGAPQEEEIEMGSSSFCGQSGGLGMGFGTTQEEGIEMGSDSFCGGMGMSFGTPQEEIIGMGSASFCGEDALFWPYLDAPIDCLL